MTPAGDTGRMARALLRCRELLDRRARLGGARRRHERDIEAARGAIAAAVAELRGAGRERFEWGDLRRTEPLSPVWGVDRGKPVDRLYIEAFLAGHARDIRGRVLEVKSSAYTDWLGGDRVTRRDVLDVDDLNPLATIVCDLAAADPIPDESFDCFILTQTLHIIRDFESALVHAARVLKPGGVLLCTLPAVSRVSLEDGGLDGGDFWRFTDASLRRVFSGAFPGGEVEITGYGNVLACVAFLYGLSLEEVEGPELWDHDPDLPLCYSVRAVKAARAPAIPSTRGTRGAVVYYHRIASLDADPSGLCVAPDEFREQMRELSRDYRPMPLESLVAAAAEGSLPSGAIAVTLDDGYVDALGEAAPILSELGVPATFFVTTDGLAEEREYWWDTLDRVLLRGGPLPPELALTWRGRPERLPTSSEAERLAARQRLHDLLLGADVSDRERLLGRLGDWSGASLFPRASHRTLTADEVRLLASRPGCEIGAHGRSHLLLPAHPIDVQAREVSGSRRLLEEPAGRPVLAFCYPFGGTSRETAEVASASGFVLATTCDEEPVRPRLDVYRVPRFEMKRGDTFGRRLAGVLEPRSGAAPRRA